MAITQEPYCPNIIYSFKTTGLPSCGGTRSLKWFVTNGTFVGNDNKDTVFVKFNNVAVKPTLKFDVKCNGVTSGTSNTASFQLKSLTSLKPTVSYTQKLPQCNRFSSVSVLPFKMPATNNLYADQLRWKLPVGWTLNNQENIVFTPASSTVNTNVTLNLPEDCLGGIVYLKGVSTTCTPQLQSDSIAIQINRTVPDVGFMGSLTALRCGVTSLQTFTADTNCIDSYLWEVPNQIADLPTGAYILQIKNNKQTIYKKIQKN